MTTSERVSGKFYQGENYTQPIQLWSSTLHILFIFLKCSIDNLSNITKKIIKIMFEYIPSDILNMKLVNHNITYIEGNYCTHVFSISVWLDQSTLMQILFSSIGNVWLCSSIMGKLKVTHRVRFWRNCELMETTEQWDNYRNIFVRDALSEWPKPKQYERNSQANMGKNLGILTHQIHHRISKELFWQTRSILRTSGFLHMKSIYFFS